VAAQRGADGGGRDLHAQPEQLSLDALVAPARILLREADDQRLQVLAILPKLEKYRYAFITDGQPDIFTAERRNIDKPTDKYTPRDYYNNGFYLELRPFDLESEVVREYRIPSGEILRTVLIES